MTDPIHPGLSQRDAQILQLLHDGAPMQRIIAIGAHRGSWNAWHVGAVIGSCFNTGTPKPTAATPTLVPTEKPPAPRPVMACGTAAGYTRHIRRKTPVCPPCRVARQDYVRARRHAQAHTAATEQPVGLWCPEPFTGRATRVDLTPAAADVLEQLCLGLPNRRIGVALGITEDTVKSHIKTVIAALGATDRTHAAVMVHTRQVRITVRGRRRQSAS